MKFQKILFALAIASFVFVGCKDKKDKKRKANQEIVNADAKQLAINISGMTCEIGCAKLIQSKLSKQDGVLDAKVVFKDSIATVKYDEAKTNKASIISFVNGLAENMYKATEAKISCDAICTKACDKTKKTETCSTDCKMACCTEKKEEVKSCSSDCKMACCTTEKV